MRAAIGEHRGEIGGVFLERAPAAAITSGSCMWPSARIIASDHCLNAWRSFFSIPIISAISSSGIGTAIASTKSHAPDPATRSMGHELCVFDLNRKSLVLLVEAGATACDSPADIGARCRIVFTSLPGPAEVRSVVDSGLLDSLREGDVHVDLTTNSVDAVRALHRLEAGRGVDFLDAPVSGGAVGAALGKLTVMASGSESAYRRVSPILSAFASNQFYLGAPGNGTLVKLVNNAIFLCSGLVMQEGFVMAAKAGLDVAQLLEIVRKSSGAVFVGLAGLFFGRDFDSPIFKLSIASKDVSLAVQSAESLGVSTPVTLAAAELYARAETCGLGSKAFFATLAALEEAAGVEVPRIPG